MTKGSDDIRMTLKSWTLLLTKYLIETQTRKRRKKKGTEKASQNWGPGQNPDSIFYIFKCSHKIHHN